MNSTAQLPGVNRLNYEQLQQRRQQNAKAREEAKKIGNALADFDPIDSVNAAALAETIGDQARYTIDHKISLARQRSALLPLVNQEVTGQRVSIFNEKVNSKFPLRGLKIKNATAQNLMQGPVSVYEGSSYAGDARLPDLQANEERLLSFAVDQAVEIKSETKSEPESLTMVRILKGVLEETHRQRNTVKYRVKNRSNQERTLDRGTSDPIRLEAGGRGEAGRTKPRLLSLRVESAVRQGSCARSRRGAHAAGEDGAAQHESEPRSHCWYAATRPVRNYARTCGRSSTTRIG